MKARTFNSNTYFDTVLEVLIPTSESVTIFYDEDLKQYLIPYNSSWYYVV